MKLSAQHSPVYTIVIGKRNILNNTTIYTVLDYSKYININFKKYLSPRATSFMTIYVTIGQAKTKMLKKSYI